MRDSKLAISSNHWKMGPGTRKGLDRFMSTDFENSITLNPKKAKIVKVVKPGDQVRIHYLGWKAKWDKEIKLTSPSVRYDKSKSKSKATVTTGNYKKGQKVMATFTDGQKVCLLSQRLSLANK